MLPALDMRAAFDDVEADRYDLHSRHLNHQMVRVLKTIGFDARFTRGRGAHLWDATGGRYLDLVSGWGVFAIGRNHPHVAAALKSALDAELPNLVQMDVPPLAGLLAERLLARAPWLQKAFFANSGAEAVEAAIKFARAATGRAGIVHCQHSFHGLTYGALSAVGETLYRDGFGPVLPGFREIPFDDLAALEQALRGRDVAAFLVEPMQGKIVRPPSPDYLKQAHALCRKYGALLIADEIQTGLGRTGRFFAVEHFGVEPDLVLIAKGLSGGHVPIGVVLMRKEVFAKTFDRMDKAVVHGSTFAKNDLAMTASLATLDVIEAEKLVENAAAKGERLLAFLRGLAGTHDFVREARGLGLMLAIELGEPKALSLRAFWAMLEKMSKGLTCQLVTIPLFKDHKILVQVAGHGSRAIKLLPTLTLDDADCAWIERGFSQTLTAAGESAGPVWALGKTLIEGARAAAGG
ncbi:MAG TPA: aspartate aminotransferase family protein [Roseiarcus sp.]|nr:aspartate aminotransferase family protein [Roseiarcus sp.]